MGALHFRKEIVSLIIKLVSAFLKLFSTQTPEPVVAPPEPEKLSIEHPWPFPSPRPEDEDFFLRQLCEGVVVAGDHVFLKAHGRIVRHMRSETGKKTHKARHIVWWMEGMDLPPGVSGLRTTCGQEKCIKLSHLEPATVVHPVKEVQTRAPETLKPTEGRVSKPVARGIAAKGNKRIDIPKFGPEDRQKCISRKVFFETQEDAGRHANLLNRPEVRGSGRKQFTYKCDLGCGGWHLTKADPKKYNDKMTKRKKSVVY